MSQTTIGIPVYNEVRFIAHTLNSILGQADQIVISDNCSTDGTSEICQQYASKHPEITYFRYNKTHSASINFINCIDLAENEYFMCIGGHDLVSRNHVAHLKNILNTTDAILAYSNAVHLNSDYEFSHAYEYDFHSALSSANPSNRILSIIKNLTDCTLFQGLFIKNILKEAWENCNQLGIDHALLTEIAARGKLHLCKNTTFYRIRPRPAEGTHLESLSRVLKSYYADKYDPAAHFPELIPINISHAQLMIAAKVAHTAPEPDIFLAQVKKILLQRWGINDLARQGILDVFRILQISSLKPAVKRPAVAEENKKTISAPPLNEFNAKKISNAYSKKCLRAMQVHTFYDTYLSAFYSAHPHLKNDTFDNQMKAFIRDAHGGIHMFIPYITNYECMLVVPNCLEAQAAWLREHGETLVNLHDWKHEIVRRQIAHFQPDVLYFADTIQFEAKFIASLPWQPKVILGWRGADVPALTDWTGYDSILSGLPRLQELAKNLGAKRGDLFHPGMPMWIAREVENIPQDTDVVFVGSISPTQHMRRLALLETLAKAAASGEFSLALHCSCHPDLISPTMRPFMRPPVFGLEMHKALRRGRIVLDTQGEIGLLRPDGKRTLDLAAGDTINMRMFEATAGGSLLLTESLPGVARYFEPNREVVLYSDHEDVVKKIRYYLSHPQERESIAEAGKKRCLTEHNMQKRVKAFLDIVRSCMDENFTTS